MESVGTLHAPPLLFTRVFVVVQLSDRVCLRLVSLSLSGLLCGNIIYKPLPGLINEDEPFSVDTDASRVGFANLDGAVIIMLRVIQCAVYI